MTDQKLVMAHVYGHCDFFKNNCWFSQTNRKMIDEMANHGNRIRDYMDRFGVEEVETFIDACLSIEDLIDIHSPFIKRRDDTTAVRLQRRRRRGRRRRRTPTRFQAKDYMDRFVNPPEALAAEADEQQQGAARSKQNFPAEPMRDVMLFLLEHAPLKPWQLDVLSIIRDEAYYFAPQAQTKIMNEGWASYWHSTIMTRHGMASRRPDLLRRSLRGHAGQLAHAAESVQAGRRAVSRHRRPLEPRRVRRGVRRLRRLRRRSATGTRSRPGPREDLRSPPDPQRPDVHRRVPDARFLPPAQAVFVRLQRGHAATTRSKAASSPKVKQRLLFNLTNVGRPIIYVRDGNYKNRGELFLEHRFSGVELQAELRPGHAREPVQALEAAGPHRDGAGRRQGRSSRSTARNIRNQETQSRRANDEQVQ